MCIPFKTAYMVQYIVYILIVLQETTEGVTTYSGYLDADLNSASTMHMWYW